MTGLALTHIGGPTVLIELAGWRILTDPTFDPPGRRYRFGWGTSSTKTTGPALEPAELGSIDAVLLTHDHHADNLDERGRAFLNAITTVITTKGGALRLKGSARGLADWETTSLTAPRRQRIDILATPCRHGPPLTRPLVGDVVGFALTTADHPDGALWISGDTVLFDGVRAVKERVDVDVAVVHLGGVRFRTTGPLRYTMTADDGIKLCRLIRPRVAIPVHYEGWSHFRDGGGAIQRAEARSSTNARVFTILPPGVRTTIPPGRDANFRAWRCSGATLNGGPSTT